MSATAASRSPALSFSKKSSIVSTAPMGGVYRRAPMGARTSLTDAWPLFGLRLRTERLELRLPTDDELVELLDLARAGIHPPGEMPFGVAWSTIPSPAFERGFLQHHWRMRATWSPDGLEPQPPDRPRRRARSARRRSARRTSPSTGRWRPDRGSAASSRAAGSARRCARRCSALPSTASGRASRRPRPSSTTRRRTRSRAPSATPRTASAAWRPRASRATTQNFRMTDELWRARPRPPLAIEGLDACRDMFGA